MKNMCVQELYTVCSHRKGLNLKSVETCNWNNGLFREKSTPPSLKAWFFDPPFHLNFQNCLSPPTPSPQDFQGQRPPHPSGFP